jgi:regulator of protease activity HflC (stomatin/prohibitin superfamily)
VDEYSVKEIEVKFDNLTPKGKDNLSLADFDVSIWYQPLASQVAEMYVKYSGMSLCDHGVCYPAYNLVARVAQGAIFDAVSQYESLTIHTKRTDLESRIKTLVQAELDKSDKGVFAVTKVIVRQIKTDPQLEASIQAAVRMQKQTEAKELEVKLARKAEARRRRRRRSRGQSASEPHPGRLADRAVPALQADRITSLCHLHGAG